MHQKILDSLNEAVLLFNQHLKLIYINNAGEILFDDSKNHLLGKYAADIFNLTANSIYVDLKKCLVTEENLVDREINLQKLKQNLTLNLSITLTIDKLGFKQLIVELQPLDRHLQLTKDEQLASQQTISRMLIRGLAHEIKNPLGGLRGAAQLLDLELENADLKEYTQIIISEADRLTDLMDKMLGPNKLPQKSKLNIHQILERVRQLVSAEFSSNIQIKCDYDPSIPKVMLDKNQFIQAVLNIVRNAIQAITTDGVIILKTRVHRCMTIGRKYYKLLVRIDIIDNGVGIKQDMQAQIFYPMITGRAEGTGLGLSISQALINQHNGLVECQSEPGNTVFSIYLPLEKNHAV